MPVEAGTPNAPGETPALLFPSGPPPINPKGPLAAIRYFYTQTQSTVEDRTTWWRERSLLPETAKIYGLRSSLREYEKVLLAMAELFPVQALLDASLYVKGDAPGSAARPNRQYFGWGVVGRSKENPDEWEQGWTFPTLIPYVDEWGEVLELRQHKRTQRGQAPRLYIPRPLKDLAVGHNIAHLAPAGQRQFAVVTEGEFKALALVQALGDMVRVIALPGITMAKPLGADLVDWLLGWKLQQVVVAYDNEEKGDPALPSFKERAYDRFDSEVWARYLAKTLSEDGFDGRVAHLPDEWRNAKKKADWDGAMALLTRSAEQPPEHWEQARGKVRTAFLGVLKQAVKVWDAKQAGWFSDEAEGIIRSKLRGISMEQNLPAGGEKEQAWSQRLFALCKKLESDDTRLPAQARRTLRALAASYGKMDGRYYEMIPLGDKPKEYWEGLLSKARTNEDAEVVRAERLMLAGWPKKASSFVIEKLFTLINQNGDQDRVVNVIPVFGEPSGPIRLPWANFAQPVKFREWIIKKMGCAFHAGEKALSMMQEDFGNALAYKQVYEVPWRGYYNGKGISESPDGQANGIYFYGDIAYPPNGKPVYADRNGVFWCVVNGKRRGFWPSESGQEDQEFRFGMPCLHPAVACTLEEFQALGREVMQRLYITCAGYGGWMALGSTFLYFAGPEYCKRFSVLPNLWAHGPPGEGKSSLVRWLMRIHGYRIPAGTGGIDLRGSSRPGMQIAMQQYGYLPVWGDELQTNHEPWVTDVAKAAFDRTIANKKQMPGEKLRQVRAALILSGVATSPDPQVRSRYVHVQVSKEIRDTFQRARGISERESQEMWAWFQKTSEERFFLFGRFIMERRADFARIMMQQMNLVMSTPAWAGLTDRAKQTYGGAYAALAAFNALIEVIPAEEMRAFRDFVIASARQSVSETHDQNMVSQFFSAFLTARQSGHLGETRSDLQRYLYAETVSEEKLRALLKEGATLPVLSDFQRKHGEENPSRRLKYHLLYFPVEPVLAELNRLQRSQGLPVEIRLADLRNQMSVLNYFVPPPNHSRYRGHRKSFAGSQLGCWCIAVELHEQGYVACPDELFEQSLQTGLKEWKDPRQGDLYSLVEAGLRGDE